MKAPFQGTIPYGTETLEVCGERKLLAAMLLDALLEVMGGGRSVAFTSSMERKLSRSRTERWMTSDEVHACPERGLSFAWVCEQLDLDAMSLRNSVLGAPGASRRVQRYVTTR